MDPASSNNQPAKQLNANTVLLAIVIAAVGWVGQKTSSNNDSLTTIGAQLPFVTQSVTELKVQIGALVTRAELDSRIATMQAANASLEKRLLVLEIESRRNKGQQQEQQ